MENILQNGMNITHNEKYNPELIFQIIQKLIDKKNLYPEILRESCNEIKIFIQFHRPEWYIELDDDLQHIVEENIKTSYLNLVNNFIMDESYNKDDCKHKSKRRRIN